MNYRKGYIYTEDGGPILPVTNDEQVKMSAGGTLKDYVEYSNEEIIIGTWFGKPLYRKCFELFNTGTSITIPLPSNTNLIKFDALQFNEYNTYLVMGYNQNDGWLNAKGGPGGINILTAQGSKRFVAIIEYTKTTD